MLYVWVTNCNPHTGAQQKRSAFMDYKWLQYEYITIHYASLNSTLWSDMLWATSNMNWIEWKLVSSFHEFFQSFTCHRAALEKVVHMPHASFMHSSKLNMCCEKEANAGSSSSWALRLELSQTVLAAAPRQSNWSFLYASTFYQFGDSSARAGLILCFLLCIGASLYTLDSPETVWAKKVAQSIERKRLGLLE